jgi:hypothetical protein
MVTINRIAEILRLQGDMADAEVRRSTAIGILAQPALALQLLWEFRNSHRPAGSPQQPGEPIHNDPEATCDHSTKDPPPAQPEPAEPVEQPVGGGLIIKPAGIDVRKLRPKVMLHIHLSHEALLSADLLGGGVGWKASDHSPSARCAGSSETAAATSRCSRSSIPKTLR